MVEPVQNVEFLSDLRHKEFNLVSPYLEGLKILKIAGLPLKFENDNGMVVIKENRALKCLGCTLGTVQSSPYFNGSTQQLSYSTFQGQLVPVW